MIPAFSMNRTLATKHEQMIGWAMMRAVNPPPAPRKHNHYGKREKFAPIWLERAEQVREVLRQYPNSESATIAECLGLKGKTVVSYMNHFRAHAEEHGIGSKKDERTGRWRYFLAAE